MKRTKLDLKTLSSHKTVRINLCNEQFKTPFNCELLWCNKKEEIKET